MSSRASTPFIRLYVSTTLEAGAPVNVVDKQAHYLLHVMRIKEGQAIHVFNGSHGEWRCEVTHRDKKSVMLEAKEHTREHYAPPKVGLIFVPIKSGAIETLIDKATELGATDLYPVLSDHSSVPRINTERLMARAVEAAEQSERLEVPALHEMTSLERLLSEWTEDKPIYYGDEAGNSPPITDFLGDAAPASWNVMVGPEGGFSVPEFRMLAAHPATIGVSLGPRILRAETASTTLLALTQSAWGDWHHAPSFRSSD